MTRISKGTRRAALPGLPLCSSLSTALSAPVRVVMQTPEGAVTLELYPDRAPVTVANFLRYVDGGLYDGAQFYRVVRRDNQAQNKIRIEVIQGGLAPAEGTPPPFPPVAHETTAETGLRHLSGTISMARLAPGTASSEFFICVTDQPELDFGGRRYPDGQGFAAFGRVINGLGVVRHIQTRETVAPEPGALTYTSGQMLRHPVPITRLRRLEEPPAPPGTPDKKGSDDER